ncbi:Glucomannan 4-beta-mannosyltransferase 9 [Actinoplanes sp. SE50]|uniref:glycosyltransferase family 2 protein n=1 Tax=unclassified Actinoplanes TaxID=2626549 RepID=UPI00023ECB5B|nr:MULTISPECIES: glycosyltransferase family 2 protein [unclassified Actinoplanes]AEV85429.1 Glucomannan 4-beta-mannosyltransferase 9 [Actinoplanes sp. SE50/110]ATO83824.1 Glucomannan 4-beta-mannosyltransferase 9 [Actinoplanes sp. SE50]SLM01232.1 glucomannan 4-beta-mannosyltransferase [Actinoplanes sp. SE50/110]
MTSTILLLAVPGFLTLYFGFFAVFNYTYAFGALTRRRPPTVPLPLDAAVAVVIVSFNEREVIADTVVACEQLTYRNKTIIVGDDSTDPETIALLRTLAQERGCTLVPGARYAGSDIELWESDRFVLFHRAENVGFKAGNLSTMEQYLRQRGFSHMYLLDADWRPQADAVERCLEVIAADPATGYVQAKRLYHYGRSDHFQRCLALNEESCYLSDLPGRQRWNHMVLFTGCCAMFDLRALYAVGGFRAGHLTEDIDLSNRFYLSGYRGVYLEDVANLGEVPPNYQAFRRQQERWAIGSARTFKEYLLPVLRSGLDLRTKWSLLRQNAYYTAALGVELSVVWSLLVVAVAVLGTGPGWPAAEPGELLRVLGYGLGPVMLVTLLSGVAPLVVTTIKKREWINLLYIPVASWIALSVVHTYAIANIKGFRNTAQSWFVTPKTNRKKGAVRIRAGRRMRAFNMVTLVAMTATYLAVYHHTPDPASLALLAVYAALWLPSMAIAAMRS